MFRLNYFATVADEWMNEWMCCHRTRLSMLVPTGNVRCELQVRCVWVQRSVLISKSSFSGHWFPCKTEKEWCLLLACIRHLMLMTGPPALLRPSSCHFVSRRFISTLICLSHMVRFPPLSHWAQLMVFYVFYAQMTCEVLYAYLYTQPSVAQ